MWEISYYVHIDTLLQRCFTGISKGFFRRKYGAKDHFRYHVWLKSNFHQIITELILINTTYLNFDRKWTLIRSGPWYGIYSQILHFGTIHCWKVYLILHKLDLKYVLPVTNWLSFRYQTISAFGLAFDTLHVSSTSSFSRIFTRLPAGWSTISIVSGGTGKKSKITLLLNTNQ